MNDTLDAIARAIFKSWFVNFDPVHEKAAGRDPTLPKHLADFFPDSLEDSEIGRIPKGWRVGRLDDVVVLQRGAPKGKCTFEVTFTPTIIGTIKGAVGITHDALGSPQVVGLSGTGQ